jgi:hypothetical protein
MKRILTSSLIALLSAAVVHAEVPMTGQWQGSTGSGSQIVLDLTATETASTGTLIRNGQRVRITVARCLMGNAMPAAYPAAGDDANTFRRS